MYAQIKLSPSSAVTVLDEELGAFTRTVRVRDSHIICKVDLLLLDSRRAPANVLQWHLRQILTKWNSLCESWFRVIVLLSWALYFSPVPPATELPGNGAIHLSMPGMSAQVPWELVE